MVSATGGERAAPRGGPARGNAQCCGEIAERQRSGKMKSTFFWWSKFPTVKKTFEAGDFFQSTVLRANDGDGNVSKDEVV